MLQTLPPMAGLTSLQEIILDDNPGLGYLPDVFPTSLLSLKASSCGLTALPYMLGNFSNLTRLFVNYNLIRELLSMIGLGKLEVLSAAHNSIRALPRTIRGLGSLETLAIQNNQIGPGLPSEIGTLNQLQFLDVGFNQLVELPASDLR